MVSSILIGAVIGAGASGNFSDRFGRRKLILIAALVFGGGAIGMALSPSISVLLVFRIITGLGVGASSVLVPTYISEIAPTEVRG